MLTKIRNFTNEQLFKFFLQIILLLSIVAPLIIDRRLFFPYVSASTLYFRLVVEILLFLWIIFIFIYPKHRPRFNFLIIGAGLYVLALALASIFSVNQILSFWGDAERMLGLFGILHYFILFLIGTTLFREKKDLKTILTVFAGVSLAMVLYGLLQKLNLASIMPGGERISSIIGNAGLLAAYLIFGLFFTVYLIGREKNKNLKIAYSISAILHLYILYSTGTRGAYLGLAAGILVTLIIILKNLRLKKLKQGIIGMIILAIIIYGSLFIFQDTAQVKNNQLLSRLISPTVINATARTRLMSWQWALLGWRDKPVLGYGLGQYSVPFSKYFEARYYTYSASKPYFDNAHNIVLEHLVSTGVIGLAAYLWLLLAIILAIIKDYKRRKDYKYLGIFLGLLTAYFIQNLFIFDSLPSYLGLAVLLIIVNGRIYEPKEGDSNLPASASDQRDEQAGEEKKITAWKKVMLVPLIIILFYGILFSYKNLIIKPYKAFKDEIAGQVVLPYKYGLGMEYLKRAVNYNTIYDMDLRADVANVIYEYYYVSGNQRDEMKEDLLYAASLYEKNLASIPSDTYYNYQAGNILNYAFSIDLDEAASNKARKYIDTALSLSPNRPRVYYLKAENLLTEGKLEEAVEAAEKAVSLHDKFPESYWVLAKVNYMARNLEAAKVALEKAIDLGYRISDESMMQFAGIYNINEGPENEIRYYELMIKNGTKNYLIYSTLANRYYEKKDKDRAIYYAEEALKLNPDVKEQIRSFIESAKEL